MMVISGWNYFWCRSLDAPGTKATGAVLLVGASAPFLSLVFHTLEVSGKPFRAGGYVGDFLAKATSEYLNRTGALVVISRSSSWPSSSRRNSRSAASSPA